MPQAADLQEPINRILLGIQLASVKGGPWQKLGRRRVQWGYLSSAPKLPGHHSRLRPFMEGFCQMENPLLALRPKGTEGSQLLLVLEHIAIPCWLAKPCQQL